MNTPPGWEGILDEGERILWQGRPDTGYYFDLSNLFTAIFGLFFAGFALFWMVMAAAIGPAPFWMFGLIHFSVGTGMTVKAIYGSTWRRRHTWYTLTTHRAFVATDIPWQGRKLNSYPIGPDTKIEYLEGQGLESIYFGTNTRPGSKGRRYTVKAGFERVEDGEDAYRIIREIKNGNQS